MHTHTHTHGAHCSATMAVQYRSETALMTDDVCFRFSVPAASPKSLAELAATLR